MTRTLVCAVAVFGIMAGSALAQEPPKAGEGPAAGAEGGGGEMKLPPGKAGEARPAGKMPGAMGGAASPGMKPNAGEAARPEPGQRRQGDNAGVEPKGQPGKAEPNGEAAGRKPGQNAEGEKAGRPATGEKPGQASGEQGKAGAAKPAPKLSGEERTRVVQTFSHVNVRPVHVNFRVNVGVVVPRTVVLEPVPPEVVTIVPAYEGYRFFAVPGEIVIVDPFTLDIVAILPL